MPDVIPPEAVRLAAAAITLAANHFEAVETESSATRFARTALEAATPLLADEIAHAELPVPDPLTAPVSVIV